MRVKFKGEAVTDWNDYLLRLMRSRRIHGDLRISNSGSPTGAVLGVGQDFTLLTTESRRTAALLTVSDEDTAMSICYCSVLDDCWLMDAPAGGKPTTVPIAQCPTYPTEFGEPEKFAKDWADEYLDAGRALGANADAAIERRPEGSDGAAGK